MTFPYDPAIANGPHPLHVASVEIVGELGTESLTNPTRRNQALEIKVTDGSGKSWVLSRQPRSSHRTSEYPLPESRINVEVDNGAYVYDDEGPRVVFSSEAKAMFGRKFAVQVNYGNTGLWQQRSEFEP